MASGVGHWGLWAATGLGNVRLLEIPYGGAAVLPASFQEESAVVGFMPVGSVLAAKAGRWWRRVAARGFDLSLRGW